MNTRSKRIVRLCLILFIILSFLALFILKGLVGRGFAESIFHQTAVIADATKPQTIILRKKFYQGYIDGMTIHCFGVLEGKATIQRILYNDGKYEGPHDQGTITGKVDFSWGGDWYSDTAEIRYIPESVSSGHLTLTYTFYD
jgi:hypothetical protein